MPLAYSPSSLGSLTESNLSLWIGTTAVPEHPSLSEDATADVCVIGSGITGLTTALLLAEAGASVVVLESDRLTSGVTAYTTGKVTALHGLTYADLLGSIGEEKTRGYAAANQAAVELVAALAERHGIVCDLVRMPALTYTERDEGVSQIEQEHAAALRVGLDAELVTETDLPFRIRTAVRLPRQIHFHPRKYCLGLAEALIARGARLFEGTRAIDVDQKSDGVTVRTDGKHVVHARHAVMATQLPFMDLGGFFVKTAPSRSYAISVKVDAALPQAMYLTKDEPSRSVRPALMGGDDHLIVGGEEHKTGQDEGSERHYATLETWARERFQVRDVTYRWSAQDYMPADGVPYIGHLVAGKDRIWVATGFKKWGMSNGTVAAMLISDGIAGRESPWRTVFDSERTNLLHSAASIVKENANVAKRFFGDRLATLSARGAEELQPGEGDIVLHQGDKVAAYRDPGGALHAVSARCTHLGCTVQFNSAETTWDCPCHGSRFSVGGAVISGPATKPLERP